GAEDVPDAHRSPNHHGRSDPRQPRTNFYQVTSMPQSLLCPDAFLSPLEIDDVVTRALAEDLGRAGDVTSIATIPEDATAQAIVVARKAGIIAGLPLVAAAFRKLAPDVAITPHARDGTSVATKTALMHVTG